MKRFDFFADDESDFTLDSQINPANGLPMLDGSSFDIAGNPFGFDLIDDGSDFMGASFSAIG